MNDRYAVCKVIMCDQNVEQPIKKVRKSLERKWSTPGDVNIAADLVFPETPVSFRS